MAAVIGILKTPMRNDKLDIKLRTTEISDLDFLLINKSYFKQSYAHPSDTCKA
jgi:hypothetical protein